ncbi:glycoside hydrolase family 47 protein [Saccharata proteae CBS 121410]|uniref:alpha-1,2-Mannosidase n=1 Tax=Saccharata proteae CBS 121410 TaxID=1314787 RepID=A0A9P4LUV2_9PEZI|nr:glycoside hydrolase family 47 protein [Saccharata proteae CBS 121410]
MPLLQRWTTYTLIAACIVFTFYRFRASSIGPDSTLAIPTRTGKFDWSAVTQRYPVKSYTPLPSGKPVSLPRVQHDFLAKGEDEAARSVREKRREDVKKAFLRCWDAYKKHAWLQDELAPVSGGAKATFGGWAATLIDALDTLWIMGLKSEFNEAVAAVQNVDLSVSSLETVNVFETTIRHLGGLLGAYDLSGDKRLLSKAVEVAEMLYVAFDTPNRMPITRWDPAPAAEGKPQQAHDTVLVAEIGSLTMEFTRLAQITGDSKWYDAVARIMDVFAYNQSKTKLPGMWPVVINAAALDFSADNFFTLGAMADSLYEYLPKMHALLGGVEPLYKKLYATSMETAIKHTVFRPMTPDEADIMAVGSCKVYKDGSVGLDPEWQHLVCFSGGMFALGGKLFEDPAHVKLGQQITDACIYSYHAWPLGIMPEVSHLVPCPSSPASTNPLAPPVCKWDEPLYNAEVLRRHKMDPSADAKLAVTQERLVPGFSQINDRRYVLRPEAIESVFVLYRVTGEERLQERAWEMWRAVDEATRTELANGALVDMTVKGSVGDSMESFWMAETLKYFYLVFSEPDLVSLDDYVLNTEAHPFKILKAS